MVKPRRSSKYLLEPAAIATLLLMACTKMHCQLLQLRHNLLFNVQTLVRRHDISLDGKQLETDGACQHRYLKNIKLYEVLKSTVWLCTVAPLRYKDSGSGKAVEGLPTVPQQHSRSAAARRTSSHLARTIMTVFATVE